jgi:hypothetical protein
MPACLSPLLKVLVERLLHVDIILTRRAAASATCAAGDVRLSLRNRHHHGTSGERSLSGRLTLYVRDRPIW